MKKRAPRNALVPVLLAAAASALAPTLAHAEPSVVTVDAALQSARTRGYDRLLAEAAHARAEGEGRAAAQLPNPVLDVGFGPLLNYVPCPSCWRYELTVALGDSGLVFELLSGRHSAKADAALAAVDAAAADRTTTQRTLDALVREQCLRLAVAEVLLRAASEQAASLAKSLETVRLRAPQVIDEGALARFELQKAAADRAVLERTASLRSAQAALAFLLGERGVAPDLRVDEALLDAPIAPELLALDEAQATTRALAARSEIVAADAQTRAADASATAARRARFPYVGLGAWLAVQGVGYPANTPLSVGGSIVVELPILDQRQGTVRTADGVVLQQRVASARARAEVGRDVASAVVALHAARDVELSARAAEGAAERALAVVARQFDAGAVPIVDRLDAERTFAAARAARAEAAGATRIAVVELERALGTEAR
jgi:outer membrane protein TolC